MKNLAFIWVLVATSSVASDCPPSDVEGSDGWYNSGLNIESSFLPDEFRGANCSESFAVTAVKISDEYSFSNIIKTIPEPGANYSYNFSIDFAEILDHSRLNKPLVIYELYVSEKSKKFSNSNNKKFLSINIDRRKYSVYHGQFFWRINFIWHDITGEEGAVEAAYFVQFSEQIDSGLLHITLNWNDHDINGATSHVFVTSNLKGMDFNSTVLMNFGIDGTVVEQDQDSVLMMPDYYVENHKPEVMKLGVINNQTGIGFGDKLLFHTPYRSLERSQR